MLLIIISVLVLGLGIFIISHDDLSSIGLVLLFFGGIFSLVFIIALIRTPFNGKEGIISYNENIKYLEIVKNNTEITDDERRNILRVIYSTNRKIEKNRAFNKSPWIGCFFYKPYGKLNVLDYNMIQSANKKITIDLEGGL